MKYRTRTFYTDKQKSEMWARWQRGESMSSIGRHFNRASSSIFPHLAHFGGIRPPSRKRSRVALRLTEREEISRGLVAKQSLRSIAKSLNRSPSTISREVRRDGGRQAYRATRSDQRAWDCATRPKSCTLVQRSIVPTDCTEITPEMVATADCRLAQAKVSGRGAASRVPRDDLS